VTQNRVHGDTGPAGSHPDRVVPSSPGSLKLRPMRLSGLRSTAPPHPVPTSGETGTLPRAWFDGAKIRSFLPILIEREVRRQMSPG